MPLVNKKNIIFCYKGIDKYLFFRIRTGIPTYAELVKYAQKKQQKHRHNLSNEIVKKEMQETSTNTDTLGLDVRTEETNTMYSIMYTYSVLVFNVINLLIYNY